MGRISSGIPDTDHVTVGSTMLVPIALPSKSTESPTRNWAAVGLMLTAVIGFGDGVGVLPPPQLHRIIASRSATQVQRKNLLAKTILQFLLVELFFERTLDYQRICIYP